jgi:hypothetical protein
MNSVGLSVLSMYVESSLSISPQGKNYSLPGIRGAPPCQRHKPMLMEDGRIYCCNTNCGLELRPEDLPPVLLGGRPIPAHSYLRKVAEKRRELDEKEARIHREQEKLDLLAVTIVNAQCTWPGCSQPPNAKSPFCTKHHTRILARNRQQKRRQRLRAGNAPS